MWPARIQGKPVWIIWLWGTLLLAGWQNPAWGQAARTPVNGSSTPAPAGVGVYQSRNFQLMTDLSPEQSQELLGRLETMLKLVSSYWGRPNRKPIQMYVIDDISRWPPAQLQQMNPAGLQMVRSGGGLTITSVRGIVGGPKLDAQAIVYATSDHGTPQHEAVHAYCGTNFGALGPVWYSEGMAEVGNYWQENDKGVKTPPYIIDYLQSMPPKPLNEIVNNPLETTGDSWQNYAWRWALCHLLGHNENYTQRFKPLGLALLAEKDVNFWTVYGTQAAEIEFEYRQFLNDMEPGYRCDLCSWDWKARFKGLSGTAQLVSKVRADRGWQASKLTVKAGTEYEIVTEGTWKLSSDGDELSASGNDAGHGKLQGILFNDFSLGEPIDVGTSTSFIAPASGDLYLRCHDRWGSLADNSGAITVRLKLKRE